MVETASELARLKDLLLRPESDRLEKLQAQVGALDSRLGTKERLEAATAEILVDAFRQTETRQHRELARAVAPVVVAAIQSEIKNSRDMMVEALYPITGRLVAAAVADAFRSLVTNINQRVDTMMSMRIWRLRLKALLTRRPFSELLLAETSRPHLRRLLYLERGSGTLLASWADEPGGNDRSDLVSGMIAAITEFSASVFEQDSGELRTIDMGASRIVLQSSARAILAGEFTGPLNPQDEQAVHQEFARLAAAHIDEVRIDTADLEASALRLSAMPSPAESKKSGSLGIWIVTALLLAIAAALAWRMWVRSSFESNVRAAFEAASAARPALKAYPLNLQVDHSAQIINLSGLAPSPDDAEHLRKTVQAQAGHFALTSDIAIVVSQEAAARTTEQMKAHTEAVQANLQAQAIAMREAAAAQAQALAGLNNEVEKLRQSMQTQGPAIDNKLGEISTALGARIAELQKLASDPREAAERFIRRQAVFFERDAELRDPVATAAMIETLAGLLRNANAGIRIIGYSSETGAAAANRKLASDRANAVANMLVEKGVSRARIVIAGRPAMLPIDDAPDAAGSNNRRVTFEPLFESEKPLP